MVRISTNEFSKAEIYQAVRIQIQEISQGFLSSLGDKALGLIFQHIANSRWGIVVLAISENENQVLGYVLGTFNSAKLYREFLPEHFFSALMHFLPKMLSFDRIKKATETLLYPAKKQDIHLPKTELLDLAVTKEFQGKGLAQELFKKFVEECKSHKIDSFKITTGASLKQAHRFYEKMGAVKCGSFELHRGDLTYIYKYEIVSNGK